MQSLPAPFLLTHLNIGPKSASVRQSFAGIRSFHRPVDFQSGWVQRRAARGQLLKCRRLYLEYLVSRCPLDVSPLFEAPDEKFNILLFFFAFCLSPTSSFFFKGMTHVLTFYFLLVHTVSPGEAAGGLLKASGAPETFLSPSSALPIAFSSTTRVFLRLCWAPYHVCAHWYLKSQICGLEKA